MDVRKKFLAHQPTTGTHSFATAAHRLVVSMPQLKPRLRWTPTSRHWYPERPLSLSLRSAPKLKDLPTSTVPGVKLGAVFSVFEFSLPPASTYAPYIARHVYRVADLELTGTLF
jgi:hypothetical protein